MKNIIYWLAKILVIIVGRIILRVKIKGRDNIPEDGPVVIMSNHISMLDPPLIGAFLPRKIYFMAKKELFENPVIGWFLKVLGAFPVKRGSGDRKALKKSLRVLRNGKVLGLFPEGTRYPEGELGEPHTGSIMIAIMGKAPIVPVGIKNIKEKGRPTLNFGEPIYLQEYFEQRPDKEKQKQIANDIMKEIDKLIVNEQNNT